MARATRVAAAPAVLAAGAVQLWLYAHDDYRSIHVTNGLFGWQEVWSGTPQAVAGFNELAALFLLLALLARARAHDTPARRRRTVSSALESDAGSRSVRTAAARDTDER